MIYFAQLATGAIKIGTTEDLGGRLAGLGSHYGQPPALLGTMPGGREREREIHARFAHLRLGKTEQFRPAPDLMAFIYPDAVEAQRPSRKAKPVRLEFSKGDHERSRRVAGERGLTMSAYAHMALFDRLRANEGRQ